MDYFGAILNSVTDKIRSSGYFQTVFGLSEKQQNGSYAIYIGAGQSKPVVNFDAQVSTVFMLLRAGLSITDSPMRRPVQCERLYQVTIPIRLVGVVKKTELPCDTETAALQVVQSLLNSLNGSDNSIKSAVNAVRVEVLPNGSNTSLQGLEIGADYAVGVVDISIVLTTTIECIPDVCESIFVPPSDCPNATVLINGVSFAIIASGATLDIPVKDDQGNLVGEKIGNEWIVPSCPECEDATAVLKDTNGNILSTTNIPSGDSQDIIAPDGSVELNGVSVGSVISGGTTDIPVRYVNGTPVGSLNAGVWEIPDPVKDLITRVQFDTGAALDYTITIDSDTAGTYTAAAFSGGMASATYEVNGSPDTLPFTLVATDTLRIIPNAVGVIKLSGTYP